MKKKKIQKEIPEEPQLIGFVENGDPPKIMTQMILPFLVSFLLCVVAIAAFTTMFRNSKWFPFTKNAPLMKQAEQLQESANIGDVRQGLELYASIYVDPYELSQLIDARAQSYTLIDLRDKVSFSKEHIKTALNVPYVDNKTDMKHIEDMAKKVKEEPVILYSYTSYTQQTLQAAIFFLQRGIQTKILRVGWNEWRHFSNLWIPEPQWQTIQVDSYVEGEGY
ncbi:MAG: Rhodanese-like domain [Candidatus Parcubacteria bacterium]|jgi:rhodanese-related sulfurtransferase